MLKVMTSERIILIEILKKRNVREPIGFIWLWIRTFSGFFFLETASEIIFATNYTSVG